MQSITLNFSDSELFNKVTWFLEHFKEEGLEILSQETQSVSVSHQATISEDSKPPISKRVPGSAKGFLNITEDFSSSLDFDTIEEFHKRSF